MKRKVLKEETRLRKWYITADHRKEYFADITAYGNAVRLDERMANQCDCETCREEEG